MLQLICNDNRNLRASDLVDEGQRVRIFQGYAHPCFLLPLGRRETGGIANLDCRMTFPWEPRANGIPVARESHLASLELMDTLSFQTLGTSLDLQWESGLLLRDRDGRAPLDSLSKDPLVSGFVISLAAAHFSLPLV